MRLGYPIPARDLTSIELAIHIETRVALDEREADERAVLAWMARSTQR